MMKKDISEIDVDEIMKRIRAEVEKRKSLSGDKSEASADSAQQNGSSLSTPLQDKGTPATANATVSEVSNAYSINDLCQYHDIDFITNAYRVILQREPGLEEVNVWLPRFRSGDLTKKEILAQLRFGPEGREKKVDVRGLLVPFILHRSFRIPVLGKLLRTLGCIVRLPLLFRNIQGLEYTVNSRYEQSNNHIELIENKIQAVESALSQKAGWSHVSSIYRSLQETDARLSSSLEETDARLSSSLQETGARLSNAIQETKGIFHAPLEKMDAELAHVVRQVRDYKFKDPEDDHVLDAMYVAFENRFRGTRKEIKERQSVYLPYVEKVQQETGDGVILDVGCGRGEWLELLAKEGYTAKGVDLNRMMVALSRELGLDVEEGDVFDCLTDMASDSLSVVTGFHIVEHLPLKTMIALFDQAYRVLKPGGLVIFETPNPENIIVGSCNFYYDPTHRNPIPPEALSFLLETRGYQNLEIVRLHENNEYADLKQTDVSEKITSRFFGPQDYSVIGYKE
ncbi:MAG: class I SAM-dependent methyltransferase [Pseudomonadota bacterium]